MSNITVGVHRVRATACALGQASTGKEQIGIELTFLDVGNETLTWYGYFTDASLDITLKALRALGWAGDDLEELDDVPDASAVLPSEAQAVVQEDYYEGEARLRVAFINQAGGGVRLKQRLDPSKKRALADRMKARILRLENDGKAPKPAPAPASQPEMKATGTDGIPATGPDDDDIPF